MSVVHLPNISGVKKNENTTSHELLQPLYSDAPFKDSVENYEKAVLVEAIKRHNSISDVCRHLKIGRSSLDNKRIKYNLD